MRGIETAALMLLVKAVYVLVTVVCIVQFATRVGRDGWHVLVPMLVRMMWAPATFLVASAVLVLRPLMNLIVYHSDLAHVVLNPSHILRSDNF